MCNFRESTVMLQPAVTYPIEIYTDERIAEFKEDEDAAAELWDKYMEEKGLVYDPATRTMYEKNATHAKTLCEKGTPYMKRKKKA